MTNTSFIPSELRIVGRRYVVSAKLPESDPPLCPKCGVQLARNGSRSLTVADLPAHWHRVEIRLTLPRHVCRRCKKSYDPRPVDLHESHYMTQRLFDAIRVEGLLRPYADIHRETGVAQTTIGEICRSYIEELDSWYKPKAPKGLCIDEVHMSKGEDYAVLSDHDRALPIAILSNVKQPALVAALRKLRRKQCCHTVVMDMTRRYRDAVRQILWWALIVVDRWHVLKMIRNCVISVTGTQFRQLPKWRPNILQVRALMLKRPSELTPKERQMLETLLAANGYLRETYDTKELILDLYKAPSFGDAAMHLDWWLDSLSRPMTYAFEEAVTAFRNWRTEILNYWLAPTPATNGPAEGANAVIKRINAAGGGHLKFELLRARVIYGEKIRRRRAAPARA